MMKINTLNGLILSGGKSARMGRDKGLIVYHDKPQREFIHNLLSRHCQEVFLSCKAEDTIPDFLNPLPDQFSIEGPLNGILTALTFNSTTAWLTVPVDMPLVVDETILYLVTHRDTSKSATCFFDSEEANPEPLLTIWEPKIFNDLNTFYQNGSISPRQFLLTQDICILHAPDKRMLTNINSPDELEAFKARL